MFWKWKHGSEGKATTKFISFFYWFKIQRAWGEIRAEHDLQSFQWSTSRAMKFLCSYKLLKPGPTSVCLHSQFSMNSHLTNECKS